NGTFTYIPNAGSTSTTDSFSYCANGSVTAAVCSSGLTATVPLTPATIEGASGIVMNGITYTANTSTYLSIKPPGVLSVDKDGAGYPLTVVKSPGPTLSGGGILSIDGNGGFNASVPGPGTYTFSYSAQNSQGTKSA